MGRGESKVKKPFLFTFFLLIIQTAAIAGVPSQPQSPERENPILNVEPAVIDFGPTEGGKILRGQLRITNKGMKMLHWKVSVPLNIADRGRYISFLNPESRGKAIYTVPGRLEATLRKEGAWGESEGFPFSNDPENGFLIFFTGSGASITVRKSEDAGSLMLYLDDQFLSEVDCRSGQRGLMDLPAGRNLPESSHHLRVSSKDGPVVIEGARIFSKNILSPPGGSLKVFPEVGDTTSETDYVNFRIFTDKMEPGIYAGAILVHSDGGDEVIDVTLNVTEANVPRILTVYKYIRGSDLLFTSKPEREDQNVLRYYRKRGIAFRLFREDTPGTRKLYRWYHPGKGDHFIRAITTFQADHCLVTIFEGAIGNIATSHLPGTKELYQWHDPVSGIHFYTLDGKGEALIKKRYRYEGILGYVR